VGRKFLAPPYYSQRAVFPSPLSAFFIKLKLKCSLWAPNGVMMCTFAVDVTYRHVFRFRVRDSLMVGLVIGSPLGFGLRFGLRFSLLFFSQYYPKLLPPGNISVGYKQSGSPKLHVSQDLNLSTVSGTLGTRFVVCFRNVPETG